MADDLKPEEGLEHAEADVARHCYALLLHTQILLHTP